jgi:hypothetical protein
MTVETIYSAGAIGSYSKTTDATTVLVKRRRKHRARRLEWGDFRTSHARLDDGVVALHTVMLPIHLWRANNLFEKEEEEECLVGGGVGLQTALPLHRIHQATFKPSFNP